MSKKSKLKVVLVFSLNIIFPLSMLKIKVIKDCEGWQVIRKLNYTNQDGTEQWRSLCFWSNDNR